MNNVEFKGNHNSRMVHNFHLWGNALVVDNFFECIVIQVKSMVM